MDYLKQFDTLNGHLSDIAGALTVIAEALKDKTVTADSKSDSETDSEVSSITCQCPGCQRIRAINEGLLQYRPQPTSGSVAHNGY